MTSLLDAKELEVAGRLRKSSLLIDRAQLVAVIGPNGAGKTSLLRAIAGIELDQGQVRICGEEILAAPPSRRMRLLSFLPATRSLVWPISARDVIELGLPSPDPTRVEALIELLELRSLASRAVNHLSTGERSRVLLARAMAARPKLLLLDEPLANLDPYWALRTLEILRQEIDQNGCAVLASLHDLSQVSAFDRVLLVDQGEIAADGAPEAVIGSSALIRAFRIERAGGGWQIRLGA